MRGCAHSANVKRRMNVGGSMAYLWATVRRLKCNRYGLACLTAATAATLIIGGGGGCGIGLTLNQSGAPLLQSISPTHGLFKGGYTLTLTGQNFQSGMTVSIGGAPCSGVTVSSTRATCTGTAITLPGLADVTIETTRGKSTLPQSFKAETFLLYTADEQGLNSFTVDPTSGALTPAMASAFPGIGPGSGGGTSVYLGPTHPNASGSAVFMVGATNGTSSQVYGCPLDPITAQLPASQSCSALTYIGSQLSLEGSALTPSGNYFYVADQTVGSEGIRCFRTSRSGGLSEIAANEVSLSGVQFLIAHPNGNILFASTSSSVYSYQIASSTGALTQISNVTAETNGLLYVDPTGQYLYSSGNSGVYSYQVAATGSLTALNGGLQVAGNAGGAFIVDALDRYAYANDGASPGHIQIYTLTAGNLTPGAFVSSGVPYPSGMALDSTGSHLYVGSLEGNQVAQFFIGSGGSLTPAAGNLYPTSRGTIGANLLLDPTEKFLYPGPDSTGFYLTGFAVNPNGSLTSLTGLPFYTYGIDGWVSIIY